jgi:hypothetical protein
MQRAVPCLLLALGGCSVPAPVPPPDPHPPSVLLGTWYDPHTRFKIEFRGDGKFADSSRNPDGSLYSEHSGDWWSDGHHLVLTELTDQSPSLSSPAVEHRYNLKWLDKDTFGFHDEDALYLQCRRQAPAR